MIQILPYVFAFTSILGGAYIALLGFKIINPKKDNPEHQERMVKWHKKFGTFAKIGGIFLVIIGTINLVFPELSAINLDQEQKSKNWSQEQKDDFKHKIINSSNYLQSINTDTADLVAKCFVEKYSAKYSVADLWELDKLPQDSVLKITIPIINECFKQYGIETSKE